MNATHKMQAGRFLLLSLIAMLLLVAAPMHSPGAESTKAKALIHTGVWTYVGRGTVNTYWIETPGGGLIVIDTQRDLTHAGLYHLCSAGNGDFWAEA